jgi:alkylation response protein AidB-like acyl-CoA dehydrogenase
MSAQGASVTPTTAPRQRDRLYHDLLSPDDALAAATQARRLADEVVAPRAREIGSREESADAFPRDVFDALAAGGLFAVPFESDVGGAQLDHPACATASVIEELAYASSSVAAIYDVHCILAGNALRFGSRELQERYLRPLIAGTKVGAFATTEPDASSDLSVTAVKTVAEDAPDGLRIHGRKRFISNSPVADFVVVLCRTGDRLSLVVVDTALDGVWVGDPDLKMGNRGQLTADVWLDGAHVPHDRVIGAPGDGLRIALATLTYGRIGIAASGVGLAQAAFDLAVSHLERRRAFGRRLGEFQHWQFLMAERAADIESARSLYLKAALRLDAGIQFPEPEAAMAKARGTALAVDMARDAIQAFGGYGFLRELGSDGSPYRLEEIYRDAKIAEIYEGANELQKFVVAREIFGKDITG